MEAGDNAVRARLKHRCLNVSRSLAVLATAFPLLTAIGWYADVPVLRSLHPALPAMQPNTALALLLAAIATAFVGDHRRSSQRFSVPVTEPDTPAQEMSERREDASARVGSGRDQVQAGRAAEYRFARDKGHSTRAGGQCSVWLRSAADPT